MLMSLDTGVSGFFDLLSGIGSLLEALWGAIRSLFSFCLDLIQLPFTVGIYMPNILSIGMTVCIVAALFKFLSERV